MPSLYGNRIERFIDMGDYAPMHPILPVLLGVDVSCDSSDTDQYLGSLQGFIRAQYPDAVVFSQKSKLFLFIYKDKIRPAEYSLIQEWKDIVHAFEAYPKRESASLRVAFGQACTSQEALRCSLAQAQSIFTLLNRDTQLRLNECSQIEQLTELFTESAVHMLDHSCIKTFFMNSSVTSACQYAVQHFNEKICLNDISNIVYLNPAYFCSLFKRETGYGFIDYLTQIRLCASKVLLTDRKLTVAQIAKAVSYNDPRFFCRLFQSAFHMRPQDFRSLYQLNLAVNNADNTA